MSGGKVIVLTGNGKGKTTSALGRCLEGWLEGKKVGVLQFIKGDRSYGELNASTHMGNSFQIKQMGLGFVRYSDKSSLELHKKNALAALDESLQLMKSKTCDIIVLDELNYAIHFNLLEEDHVVEVIRQKPEDLVLIITGRYARHSIIDQCDEVYEFNDVKHYSAKGVAAREGIEY